MILACKNGYILIIRQCWVVIVRAFKEKNINKNIINLVATMLLSGTSNTTALALLSTDPFSRHIRGHGQMCIMEYNTWTFSMDHKYKKRVSCLFAMNQNEWSI